MVQIKNGTNYACTGLNNSDQIGRAGFNRMMAILAGASPEQDTYLPSPLITIDNVTSTTTRTACFRKNRWIRKNVATLHRDLVKTSHHQ